MCVYLKKNVVAISSGVALFCLNARYLFTAHLETMASAIGWLYCALNKWRTKLTLPLSTLTVPRYLFTCFAGCVFLSLHLCIGWFALCHFCSPILAAAALEHGRHIINAITFDGKICTWRSLLTFAVLRIQMLATNGRRRGRGREREEAKATEKEIYSMIALDASSNKMAGNVDQSN